MQIKPVFENKKALPIVFSFNNEYSKYFAVALKSLIDNTNNQLFYDIVVFSSDISERNRKLLEEMLPQNFSLRFFNVSNILEDINLPTMKYWSIDMYYRIIIPIIMPDYEKVLYLDSDIVIKDDISRLFDINFEGNKLLAIPDSFNLVSCLKESEERNEYIKNCLSLSNSDMYFNSGVLLFNIQSFNAKEYLETIKQTFSKIQKTYCLIRIF